MSLESSSLMNLQTSRAGADSFALLSQKWSKGKMKEKVNNQVLFDKVYSAC